MNVLQWSKAKLGALFEKWRRPAKSYQPSVVSQKPVVAKSKKVRHCKAYADQRQKAKRNRRQKPSKAMKNLYRLS